jgi:hypothetical protein
MFGIKTTIFRKKNKNTGKIYAYILPKVGHFEILNLTVNMQRKIASLHIITGHLPQ